MKIVGYTPQQVDVMTSVADELARASGLPVTSIAVHHGGDLSDCAWGEFSSWVETPEVLCQIEVHGYWFVILIWERGDDLDAVIVDRDGSGQTAYPEPDHYILLEGEARTLRPELHNRFAARIAMEAFARVPMEAAKRWYAESIANIDKARELYLAHQASKPQEAQGA